MKKKQFVTALVFAAAAGLTMLLVVPLQNATANHLPADKIGVAGSAIQEVGPGEKVLLTSTLRNSTPTDLMIQVTSECALWTNITSPSSEAVASVTVWVTLDGVPVPVTSDPAQGGPDDGKVVFCNRDFKILALLSPQELIQLCLSSKSANAFNWVAMNVGNGIHTIEVRASLDQRVTGIGFAQAAVGKRTLIVEPAKLANDASI